MPHQPLLSPHWKQFDVPRPQVVVSGFAVNSKGEFPILWRTDKVRSAPNCWSLPSGLHEVGLTKAQQFSNELEEELGLIPNSEICLNLGSYENILPEEGWHWSLDVLAIPVLDGVITNKEPDKHDPIKWATADEIFRLALEPVRGFQPALSKWIINNQKDILQALDICKG